MNRWTKIGLVLGGYALAFGAAIVAGQMYNARMAAMPYDTSGGMYAAGESFQMLGVFLPLAFVPTALALWFLRGNTTLWKIIAVGAIGFAGVGLIATAYVMTRPVPTANLGVVFLELFGLAQLLGVPIWTVAFGVLAFLAPTRPSRRLLVAAVGVELVIAVCAVFHWFLRQPGA